jgi:putative tryptophan/tyrosine transport system substrate-binding protein
MSERKKPMSLLSRRFKALWVGIAVLLCSFGLSPSYGESPEKPVRVGLLLTGFELTYSQAESEFLSGMREMGYVEGKNLLLERRYAHLQPERMAELAKELATMKLDAVITGCTVSTRAMQRATIHTPIVMASVADPVEQGFVQSISRSGTNVTGRSSQSRELLPKMLELFRTAVPKAERIAVLIHQRNTVHQSLWPAAVTAAKSLNLELLQLEVPGPSQLDAALERFDVSRVQGLLVLPDDPMSLNHRAKIVAFANKHSLPSLFGYREFVENGGFMSYGEKFAESYRHTARYVDKVAHGVNPSQLPIEQPTRFEFVINLKTAAALGVNVPKSLMLRADETMK